MASRHRPNALKSTREAASHTITLAARKARIPAWIVKRAERAGFSAKILRPDHAEKLAAAVGSNKATVSTAV